MSDDFEEVARRLVVGHKSDARSVYDETAKAELVAACARPGASVSRLARELSRWVREHSERRQQRAVAVSRTDREAFVGIGLMLLSAGLASLATLTPGSSTVSIVWRMALCRFGFGFGFALFQSPNLNALMSSAPPERSGGASGMVAMARLNGQAIGAALVALCFGLAGERGPVWALWLGAGVAGLAALASSARLLVPRSS